MSRRTVLTGLAAAVLTLSACGATSPAATDTTPTSAGPTATSTATPSATTSAVDSTPATDTISGTTASSTSGAATTSSGPSHTRSATPSASATTTRPPATGRGIPYRERPVIVIDPGHSRTIDAVDHRTGLNVSDYENEPEMRDVYQVALLVRTQLQRAGYRVVMTKKSLDERVDLAQRAYLANRVHAALALSIHDQAGADGGIGFRQGNNTVYYQSVGTYRATPSGKRVYFRNKHLAAVSKRFGGIFRRHREDAQGTHVNLQGNVGYNLGSRGLAAGDIWMVQLLSTVPWIYNEAGGNSSGRVGLDSADRHTYARGLVASVETCVPLPRH